jgi:hypothetical protein
MLAACIMAISLAETNLLVNANSMTGVFAGLVANSVLYLGRTGLQTLEPNVRFEAAACFRECSVEGAKQLCGA